MGGRRRAMQWGVGTLALALALGCGGEGREAKLEQARERVDEAKERLIAAESMLEERREAFEKTRERLEEARERVAEAEAELGEARKEVSAHTSDAVVFRSVQRRLLEDEELEPVAISASVEEGVVTLAGEVPSEALRERAVELARETTGVVDVLSRIEVAEGTGEGG